MKLLPFWPFGETRKPSGKKQSTVSRRRLKVESLENRELLSTTVADLPSPDYEPSDTILTSETCSEEIDAKTSFQAFAAISSSTVVELGAPAKARTSYTSTASTVTVYWGDPSAKKNQSVDEITGFRIVLIDMSTGRTVDEVLCSDSMLREYTFTGLGENSRYKATVTSCGGSGTSNANATLTITGIKTKALTLPTLRATGATVSGVTLQVYDKDSLYPFENGKTVKSYTIQYVEKTGSTPNWSKAESTHVDPNTSVDNLTQKYFYVALNDLQPATSYYVRVTWTYIENGKTLTAEIRKPVTFKTSTLLTSSISKISYTLDNDDLALNVTGKLASVSKLGNTDVSYQLLVSLTSTTDKTTKKLTDAKTISIDLASFGEIDPRTGVFSLKSPLAFSAIAELLGASNLVGAKTLSFQLVATFDMTRPGGSENLATNYSKVSRFNLPNWYNV